jgi:acetoin utilization protein AcuB
MLVKNWMSRNVIRIDVNEPMSRAIKLMRQYKIRSLPVVKNDKLVGIITNGDIKKASASEANTLEIHELAYLIDQIKVGEIMTKNVITISPLLTIDEAAEIFFKNNISCAPVMDENKDIIGMLTKTDILKVLISLTGMDKRGADFGFQVADVAGSIKEITDIIRQHTGRISSILISYEQAPVGFRNVYIRVFQIDRSQLALLRKELMKRTKILYVLDFIDKTREVY